MCGRYTHTTRRSDEIQAKLADTLGVATPPSGHGFERFNIAPTQEVLAVVDDRHGRRIEPLRWGLVPHWAKELNTRFSRGCPTFCVWDRGDCCHVSRAVGLRSGS
jgi:putative SOS response-associated peptidase YedK